MKKQMMLGLVLSSFCATFVYGADTINVTNNLKYGVANRGADGKISIANICSADAETCTMGTVRRAGQVVPVDRLIVRINVNGVDIMPGQTKAVPKTGVNLTAYYDTVVLPFTAPIQNDLEFPRDFKLVN